VSAPTFHVYALRFTGSDGHHFDGFFLHRRDAKAAQEAKEAEWRAFEDGQPRYKAIRGSWTLC